jgi:soluble lytic murein transglycosylase-like protein
VAGNVAAAPGPDALLFGHASSGASNATAKAQGAGPVGGPEASAAIAAADRGRLLPMAPVFQEAARQTGLPAALLAAIASRETRGGQQLDANGYSRWDGQGFGIMQVDKRSHTPRGAPDGLEHVLQAAQILKGMWNAAKKARPDLPDDETLQMAVAAYNGGPRVFGAAPNYDRRTTGGDYSNDTWARARALAPDFSGAPQRR